MFLGLCGMSEWVEPRCKYKTPGHFLSSCRELAPYYVCPTVSRNLEVRAGSELHPHSTPASACPLALQPRQGPPSSCFLSISPSAALHHRLFPLPRYGLSAFKIKGTSNSLLGHSWDSPTVESEGRGQDLLEAGLRPGAGLQSWLMGPRLLS